MRTFKVALDFFFWPFRVREKASAKHIQPATPCAWQFGLDALSQARISNFVRHSPPKSVWMDATVFEPGINKRGLNGPAGMPRVAIPVGDWVNTQPSGSKFNSLYLIVVRPTFVIPTHTDPFL
jgi:hypothetical protein